jgi:hypothetical protein
MIQNIVDRAKKLAIKESLETGQKGLQVAHLLAACVAEFSENEDLPNTTNTGRPGTNLGPEARDRGRPLHRHRRTSASAGYGGLSWLHSDGLKWPQLDPQDPCAG